MNGYSTVNWVNYFVEDGSQNYLVLQPVLSIFKHLLVQIKFWQENVKDCQKRILQLQLHRAIILSQHWLLFITGIGTKYKGNCLAQDNMCFTHRNVVNLFIVYKLGTWARHLNTDFTLDDCLFEAVKLTNNADPGTHEYSGYGIGFDARSQFLLSNGEWGKDVILGVDNSSSIHADNRKKYILVLGKGLTDGLDDATVTTKTKYSINIIKKKICLNVHSNGSNSFLYADGVKIYQFKAKDSKIKEYIHCA